MAEEPCRLDPQAAIHKCCSNIFVVYNRVMATLSDFVSEIATQTNFGRATIFAYGRFAREAGLIKQGGRGKGGAQMTESDAANLLIAIAGTSITREAPNAIQLFRPMRGRVGFLREDLEPTFREWLKPLKLKGKHKTDLSVDLGNFLEWLIRETRDFKLYEFLRRIPVVVVRDEDHARLYEKYRDSSIDKAIFDGELTPQKVELNKVREHIELNLTLERTTPTAHLEIKRKWGEFETVLEINFALERQINDYLSNIVVSSTINEQIVLFVGKLLWPPEPRAKQA